MESSEVDGKVKVRRIQSGDLESVYSINKECFLVDSSSHYSRFFISQAYEIFTDTFLVAEKEKKYFSEIEIMPNVFRKRFAGIEKQIVGYILSVPDAQTKKAARILSMAVITTKRRRRIGLKLLSALERRFNRKGISPVYLSVTEDNTDAIAFFKKNKFGEAFYANEKKEFITVRVEDKFYGKDMSRIVMIKHYKYSDESKKAVRLNKLIDHIKTLYLEDHMKILKSIIEFSGDKKKFLKKSHEYFGEAYYREMGGKKADYVRHIENWMEKYLLNSGHPEKLTPSRLAYEYRIRFHWKPGMRPFLMKVARRVKQRLCMRKIRDAQARNENRTDEIDHMNIEPCTSSEGNQDELTETAVCP